ncbi:right-handed parallel beta-helix repeat-containing protein [bacterium]|nr:right-handed parallel beta-helix repeat-containing protein [candidate division CSSED10-310 bacterium]
MGTGVLLNKLERSAWLTWLPAVITLMLLLSTSIPAVHARATWYVAVDGDDGAAGTIENPFATIQHAVDVAEEYDAVMVAAGTYSCYTNGEEYPLWIETTGLTITGAGPNATVLDANYLAGIVEIWTDEVTISEMSLVQGANESSGGGICISGYDIVLQRLGVERNRCRSTGAGIYAEGGLTVMDCNLSHNLNGDQGGALGSEYLQLLFQGNTVVGNTADGSGGAGIFTWQCELEVTHSLFAENESNCIYVHDWSDGSVRNCLFVNNVMAEEWDGGSGILVQQGSTLEIINNTFVANAAAEGSGAMFANWHGGDSYLYNNIFAQHPQGSAIGCNGGAFIIDYNNLYDNLPDDYGTCDSGANDIHSDPLFVDQAGGDYHLQAGSPSINAGDPDPMYNDFDGSRNDLGAYGGPDGNLPVGSTVSFSTLPQYDTGYEFVDVDEHYELYQYMMGCMDVDEDHVAYFGRDDSWEEQVFLWTEGATEPLALTSEGISTYEGLAMRVSGGYVCWGNYSRTREAPELYIYDIAAGLPPEVIPGSSGAIRSDMDAGNVVFIAMEQVSMENHVFHWTPGMTAPVRLTPLDAGNSESVYVQGDEVVWVHEDGVSGNREVFYYNLDTGGPVTQISAAGGEYVDYPRIDNGLVAWEQDDSLNGTRRIMAWRDDGQGIRTLSPETNYAYYPKVSDGRIVWLEEDNDGFSRLMLWDGASRSITSIPGTRFAGEQFDFDGGIVTWLTVGMQVAAIDLESPRPYTVSCDETLALAWDNQEVRTKDGRVAWFSYRETPEEQAWVLITAVSTPPGPPPPVPAMGGVSTGILLAVFALVMGLSRCRLKD